MDDVPATSAFFVIQRPVHDALPASNGVFLSAIHARSGRNAGTAGLSALLAPAICCRKQVNISATSQTGSERLPEDVRA
ncbi:MAG: hypothetical protein K6E40_02960 [Desulfovibrio sp.]|nr:hypothetical protein [Desulfovibrio sp.]